MIKLKVKHEPPPKGMKEVTLIKNPGDKLGISIRGGSKGHPGNPLDKTDEGIFISKVSDGGSAAKDGRLKVGMRILEVNGTSLIGATHVEAVRSLRSVGDKLTLVICDGYDPETVTVDHVDSTHTNGVAKPEEKQALQDGPHKKEKDGLLDSG